MSPAPQPITGHCLCGSVTYRADAEPIAQAVCHCTDCQRQSGTAFSVVVGVPRAALTIEGSTLASFTTKGEEHGSDTERSFCSACGSPIVSVIAAAPEMAFLKVGTLDDASWVEPGIEVWSRSAQPWAPHFEHVATFERGPG
ncbi:MAG TPA: GFA family protein [Solirubrobacteraceae bacterium]|nr:GFA family protein [Solirubrobacteraceae bacterium]